MTLDSFIRSPLGAFTKSALGARNGATAFEPCIVGVIPGRVSTGGCSASVTGPYRDPSNHTFRVKVTDPSSACPTWPNGTTYDVLLFFDRTEGGKHHFKRVPFSYNNNAPVGLQVELSVIATAWTTFQTTNQYDILVHNGSVGYRINYNASESANGRVSVGAGLTEACSGQCPTVTPSTFQSRAMWIRRPDSDASKTITVVIRQVSTGTNHTVQLTNAAGTFGSFLFDGYATFWSYVGTVNGQQVVFSGQTGTVQLQVGGAFYTGRWRYKATSRDLDSSNWLITAFEDCGASTPGAPNQWVLVSITES